MTEYLQWIVDAVLFGLATGSAVALLRAVIE